MIRLLVCDDSESSRRLIRTLVESLLGIEIVGMAGSGDESLRLASALEPDVVLMDVRMPGVDGVETTRALKKLLPTARVVAFAASEEESDVKAMIDAGASAYCVKGCSAWELQREIVGTADPLARLAHLLSRSVPGSVGRLLVRELADSTGGILAALYVAAGDTPIELVAAHPAAEGGEDGFIPGLARRCVAVAMPVQATPEERRELGAFGAVPGETLAVPVVAYGLTLGALLVGAPEGAAAMDVEFVSAAADLAAAALTNELRIAMGHTIARRDVLTGLLNRRAFEEALEVALPSAGAEAPLSLAVFDIDDFKSINDESGHAGGDETLRLLARIALRTARAEEEIFRVGGDEFAVIVGGTASTAQAVVSRIQEAILRQRRLGHSYTISAGIASCPPALTANDLLSAADEALYEGKRNGRNRITIHSSAPSTAKDEHAPRRRQGPRARLSRTEDAFEKTSRLLVVHSDPGLWAALRVMLSELGAVLEEAHSAGAAATLVAKSPPALVVLDAALPGGDSLSFCRALKSSPDTRRIPVVVLCGSEPVSVEAFRSAGADAVHTKPPQPVELLSLIHRAAVFDNAVAFDAPGRSSETPDEGARRSSPQRDFYETFAALNTALAAKDSQTAAHSKRVVMYAGLLTEVFAPRLLAVPSLEYGFLLHDVGKIGIPDGILQKPGPLSRQEFAVMQTHTLLGEEWLKDVPALAGHGLQVIRSHHERWDGGGYPDGRRKEEIPVGGRIFSVADTLDAMTTDRPYSEAVTWSAAAEEIARERGRQFDPNVVDAFTEATAELKAIHDQFAAAGATAAAG